MKRPATSDPTKTGDTGTERHSPYVPVKIAAGAFAGVSLCYAVLGPLTGSYVIPGISFCPPVEPGEFYNFILDGRPCRITFGSALNFIGAFGITSMVLQIPTLILWAVLAIREWRHKPYSRHSPVRVMAITVFAFSFCLIAWDFYGPFLKNTQGEYCDYVTPGEPYHLVMEGDPCRVTSQFFLEFGLFLVVTNIPLQIPTLILWAAIASRPRRREGAANG